jgi:hypothetical protein
MPRGECSPVVMSSDANGIPAEPDGTIPRPDGTIPREWRRWAAVSLMEGTPLVDVVAGLTEQGFPSSDVTRFCARLYDDAAFEAGRWVGEQLRKLQSLLSMRQQMRATSDVPVSIDRRSGLSRQEFVDEYYSRNEPVLLTDVCAGWPARELWQPEYLLAKLGNTEVEVMAGREADPNYELNANEHKFMMPFDEYVAKIGGPARSNDMYLVANNGLLHSPAALPLWDDFELDPRFLKPDPDHSQAFLWFGPAGTVTPLHHDTVNVLFNQVAGRKHFVLVPALEIHRVYNNIAVYSPLNPLDPDLKTYPSFAGATQIHFDVEPGDSVFLPAGWWHHVESLEPSISVSFTNFAFDNDIEWTHPTLVL